MSKYTVFPNKKVNYTSKKGVNYEITNENGRLVCISKGRKCRPTKEILSKYAVPGGQYTVYSDGGCINNPGGKGGFGCVVINKSTGEVLQHRGSFYPTTNNRMEIRGAIEGLKLTPKGASIDLYTDSDYVVRSMNGEYQKKKNNDLWDELDSVCRGRYVKFYWVRGHAGNAMNEVCDKLATQSISSDEPVKDEGYWGIQKDFSIIKVEEAVTVESHTIGKVNDRCRECLEVFFSRTEHRFRDYAALKTGGLDYYSTMGTSELLSICHADMNEVRKHLCGTDINTALRWHCRGLSLQDSIRKVLVDKEIQRNAYEANNRR